MTRKRFVKLLMSKGLSRNEANWHCKAIRKRHPMAALLQDDTTGLMPQTDDVTRDRPGSRCAWWDKPLEHVSEYEQERCGEYGWSCDSCIYFDSEE